MVVLVNYKKQLRYSNKISRQIHGFRELHLVSAFIDLILNKLVLWTHIQQLISGTETFVQVTFVLVTITNLQTLTQLQLANVKD